ncbi:hypothetical protein Tco_0785447 [Tanacetum coccineum]
MINCDVKGVTTRGGKTTTQDVHDNNTNVLPKEPVVDEPEKPVRSNEVLTNDQPQMTSEPVVQASNETQTPPVPFPRRLRKEKEEAQQKKFLDNLKQLHINLPFNEALAQMPKPNTEDDECYGIDDLDETINEEAQELLANEEPDSFLSRGLEKSIDQSDLECCKSASNDEKNGSDSENLIRRIDSANTPYLVT